MTTTQKNEGCRSQPELQQLFEKHFNESYCSNMPDY